jgi:hypothetical protein
LDLRRDCAALRGFCPVEFSVKPFDFAQGRLFGRASEFAATRITYP